MKYSLAILPILYCKWMLISTLRQILSRIFLGKSCQSIVTDHNYCRKNPARKHILNESTWKTCAEEQNWFHCILNSMNVEDCTQKNDLHDISVYMYNTLYICYLVIFWGPWVQRPPKKQFCNYTSKRPCINGFTKWQTKNNLWCSVEMKERSNGMTLILKKKS